MTDHDLIRFLDAQDQIYGQVIEELTKGRAIITGESGQRTLTRYRLEEYVADCVILLDNRVQDQLSTRRLRVVKYRGSAHGTNEYPFIIDEQGITVMQMDSRTMLRFTLHGDFWRPCDVRSTPEGGHCRPTVGWPLSAQKQTSRDAVCFFGRIADIDRRCRYVRQMTIPTRRRRGLARPAVRRSVQPVTGLPRIARVQAARARGSRLRPSRRS